MLLPQNWFPQSRSSAASADKTEHAQKKFDALDLIHSHFLNEITHFFYTSIAELAMLWFCLEGVQWRGMMIKQE